MPASPRTPPPSPPIPVFNLLVTLPLHSQAPMKPILVYSRRRFCPSGLPVVGVEAAELAAPPPASSPMPAAATASAPPPASSLVDPAVLGAGPLQAATTVLPPAAAGEPSPSAVGVGVIQEAPAPPPASSSTVVPAASRAAFINKLARRAGGLLPVPAINKRRGKTVPIGDTPRRSRRLAGAKSEFGLNDLERRSKKKAMRTLELIEEHEGIDQQALDEYAKLFEQPLPGSHL